MELSCPSIIFFFANKYHQMSSIYFNLRALFFFIRKLPHLLPSFEGLGDQRGWTWAFKKFAMKTHIYLNYNLLSFNRAAQKILKRQINQIRWTWNSNHGLSRSRVNSSINKNLQKINNLSEIRRNPIWWGEGGHKFVVLSEGFVRGSS